MGHLVLIGGAEDKRGEMLVLRRIVELSEARSVVVIPTASDEPRVRVEEYRAAFTTLGVAEVSVADARTRAAAGQPAALEAVQRADTVFFTGGDQVRLVRVLAGTPLLAEVWAALRRGVTVAGTSAGAAATGEVTIYHGDGAGHSKGSVRHTTGFGFVEGLVVDTHFDARGRLSRLAQFLCSGGGLRGVGLAENTAVVIAPTGLAEVVGSGVVTVVDASDVEASNYDSVAEEDLLTVTGLSVGFLAPGTVFDLERWRVAALPPPSAIIIGGRSNELQKGLRAE
jgi:cyanophycinase